MTSKTARDAVNPSVAATFLLRETANTFVEISFFLCQTVNAHVAAASFFRATLKRKSDKATLSVSGHFAFSPMLSESSERLIQRVEYFRKVPRDLYSVQSAFGKFRETYTTCRVLSKSSERPIQRAAYFRKVPRDPYNIQRTFGKFRETHTTCRVLSESSERLIQCVEYFRKFPRDSYNMQSTFGKFRETYTMCRILSEVSESTIKFSFTPLLTRNYAMGDVLRPSANRASMMERSLGVSMSRVSMERIVWDTSIGHFGIKQEEVTPFWRHL